MAKFWIQPPSGKPLVFEADVVSDSGNGLIAYIASFTSGSIDIGLYREPDCIQEQDNNGQKTLILRTANYRDEAQKVVWDKEVLKHNNPDGGNVLAPSP